MKFLTLISHLAILANVAIAGTTAAHAAEGLVPNGYTIADPVFVGEVNGEKFELKGTASTVLADLKSKYPKVDFVAVAMNKTAAYASAANPEATSENKAAVLTRRNKVFPPLCVPVRGWSWGGADGNHAWGCYDQIRSIPGRLAVPGRSQCAVYCCNQSARVLVCNDHPSTIYPHAGYIASYVKDLVDNCGPRNGGAVGGQLFDTDRYNVIVRRTTNWDVNC